MAKKQTVQEARTKRARSESHLSSSDHQRYSNMLMNSVARTLFRRATFSSRRPIVAVRPQLFSFRNLSFTFAGPRKLEDLIKKELMEDKAGTEVVDIWYTYHEEKVRTS